MTLATLKNRWLPFLKGNPTPRQANQYAKDVEAFKQINPNWREYIN